MKPGVVISLRINPKQCQTILAIADIAGVQRTNQSFSSIVSIVLSGMLDAEIARGKVREPDPFRYWEEMEQYHKDKRKGYTKSVTEALAGRSEDVTEHARQSVDSDTTGMVDHGQISMIDAGKRLQWLITKEQEDTEEYKRLYKIVYPYG